MTIIRAQHLGMCFGVRDAIALAKHSVLSQPLTILGELVHNEHVLADLRKAGIEIETNLDNVTTRRAMITAHGASEKMIQRARDKGLDLVQATCPLVHHAHRSLRKLVAEGYHPVIIGKGDHVEVRGMTEDLEAFDVVLNEREIELLPHHDKFGIVAQTTQPLARVQGLIQALRERFPASEVRYIDTVCQPTKQRQQAAQELAQKSDLVIVIGGAGSNNTRELVNTCGR